jgi:serine/threonine-protein kinase SRK2
MTDEYQMSVQMNDINTPSQGLEEIMAIIQEARKPGDGSKFSGQIPGLGSMELDDIDTDDIDVEDSGDFVCAL